jgi:hypothetical protein
MWKSLENSWVGKFIFNINEAAKYKDGGYSWRKIFSVPCLLVAIDVTHTHTNPTNLDIVLNSWLIFVAFILGLVTVQQVLQFKGAAGTTSTQTTESTSSTTKVTPQS